jgi:ribosomal-protein-alanine N-acetyltransferase
MTTNDVMTPQHLHIRTLQVEDASPLLEFELENRDWFERHVLPRGDAFYCVAGVADHIDECLSAFMAGQMHPCLILDDADKIIGRANLKDIDSSEGTTEIGYRIAQAHVGRGVATYALRHLMDLAYDRWQLTRLLAIVTSSNAASGRVLEKNGFIRKGLETKKCEIREQVLDRYRYEHLRSMRA